MDRKFIIHSFIIFVASLFLISCGTKTEKPEIIQPKEPEVKIVIKPTAITLQHVKGLEENKNWQSAFNAWKDIANNSTDGKKAFYLNRAALMLQLFEKTDLINGFYESVDFNNPTPEDIKNQKVLMAAILHKQGKNYRSIRFIPDLDSIKDIDFLKVAADVKANASMAVGNPLQSIESRLKLHQYLDEKETRTENNLFIWDSLTKLSESKTVKALSTNKSKTLKGWLELSLIAKRSKLLPKTLLPWIDRWQQTYQQHQATELANDLIVQSKNIYFDPKKISIMLPMDGKLTKVSQAILNGFIYAYHQSDRDKAELNFINIDPKTPFKEQYLKAIDEGAELIIGPLDKLSISELGSNSESNIHTLALNYSSEGETAEKLFQFGLRPEDEATQIADYALLNQDYNAAVLTPNNSWGKRMANAFKKQYSEFGGSVLSEIHYPAKTNDYAKAITQLLNIDSSNARHNLIQRVVGQKVEFTPRRRQDLDMIFIAANARQARIIRPQLKFHYAKDIQVYATSHIVSPQSKKSIDEDRDLDGVYYVDMPWTLNAETSKEVQDINSHWPSLGQSHGKLFALGIDAFHLIPKLNRLRMNQEEKIDALTGNLSIAVDGNVRRELLLATYKDGQQVKINIDELR